MAEPHDLQLRLRRSGRIDERRIDGWQFEDEHGRLAWHVRTWPNNGEPIDDYWVEGGEFYEVTGLHLVINRLPLNRIETGRMITEMDTSKRDAILKAIDEWEKPEENPVKL